MGMLGGAPAPPFASAFGDTDGQVRIKSFDRCGPSKRPASIKWEPVRIDQGESTKAVRTSDVHVYKTNKTSAKNRKKNNRFSKDLIKQTGLLPYNTPLKCTYPGTFSQISQKVVGHLFGKKKLNFCCFEKT